MADILSQKSSIESIENYLLIWLDQNLNESTILFQPFINTIKFFSDPDECRQFIKEIIDEKLFLIVSGSFGEQFVPEWEVQLQICAIYVYCQRKEYHENWAKDFTKVKGVYTDLHSISDAFRRDIRQANTNLLPIHLYSTNNPNQSFLCSLIFKNTLRHIPRNDHSKQELIEYARRHCSSTDVVTEYEKSDYAQITPIEWYTRECFLSAMIHRAFRLHDLAILNKINFFIQDLHGQIRDLYQKSVDPQRFTVYYGQSIPREQFDKFPMNINDLITFDGFLLTTIDRGLSLEFAKQSANTGKQISLLYQIELDRLKSFTPFIPLDKFDYYHDTDQHVLLSFDAIFRLTKCEQIDEQCWQMNLTLIDSNDPQSIDLNRIIEKSKGFLTVGQLLFRMNEFHRAEKFFQVLLHQSNPIDQKQVHQMLGRIYQKHEDFPRALVHYQESIKLESTAVDSVAIGAIFEKLGNLNQAAEYFKRAVEYPKTSAKLRVFYYLSLGRVLYKQGENSSARVNFELARKLTQRSPRDTQSYLPEIQHYLALIS